MRAYVDSDVLIRHLRGDPKALKFLRRVSQDDALELWTGALQRAEVVFFMRPEEVEATELFLSQFMTSPVDSRLVDAAGRLFRTWNPTHGIDVNDAFLAATAQSTGGKIFTLNLKHYPMPDLAVEKAW